MIESMIRPSVRPGSSRGHANHGWLDSYHSFSFADYHNAERVHFGALRVINDDRIEAAKGFGMHGHRDMEIITYLLEGELMHKDSMGNGAPIRPGDVQRMSAGTGVLHSEFNNSPDHPTHLIQIWILPDEGSLVPSYEQRFFTPEEKDGRLALVASRDGRDGSVRVHQDVSLYAGLFHGDQSARHAVAPGRGVYVHVARGEVALNGIRLVGGDAATFEEPGEIHVTGGRHGEILLFDLEQDTTQR